MEHRACRRSPRVPARACRPGRQVGPAAEPSGRNEPLFPNQLFKDSLFILGICIAICSLALISPAGLEPRADPTDTSYNNPRPEWYFYFMFQILRFFEGPFETVGTFVLPALTGVILVLLPFLDKKAERARKALMLVAGLTVIGVIVLTILGGLMPMVQPPRVTAAPRFLPAGRSTIKTGAAPATASRARAAG